jgi:hypothetical protein
MIDSVQRVTRRGGTGLPCWPPPKNASKNETMRGV